MTNLSPIYGMNKYCGPGVLSALTGKPTDECAKVISGINGKKEIKSVEIETLRTAILRLGFRTIDVNSSGHSLYSLLTSIYYKDGFYVVNVPGHVVALEVNNKKIYFIDNHTKQAINAGSSARLSQKVVLAWKVERKSDEELAAERLDYRKRYYNQRINSINAQIAALMAERSEAERELDKLK